MDGNQGRKDGWNGLGSWDWRIHTAAAKSLQSCPTRCDPRDGSPPGSPVPGILQARTLEWVAISFSNAWKWKVKGKSLNWVRLLATPWTAAHQAPPSMGFSREEYWSGVPLPSPYTHYCAENRYLMRTYCIVQGTLLSALGWPKWEGNPKKRAYMYMYSWFTLLYSRN